MVRTLYRSRLVAKELKMTNPEMLFFTGAPPTHSLKFLFSLAVTSEYSGADGSPLRHCLGDWLLSFVGVKKAHFYARATRDVFIELPEEAKAPPGQVGKLNRTMYGCLSWYHLQSKAGW